MTTESTTSVFSAPEGWLLLSHPVHWTISSREMVQALPHEILRLPRNEHALDCVRIPMDAAGEIDWTNVQQQTERALQDQLRPLLHRSPGYHVAYFGAAPIALAMFLGFHVGTWATIHPFQKRHDTGVWNWNSSEKTIEVKVEGIPVDRTRGRGDVVIRVMTSHSIELQDVLDVVPDALAEVSIQTIPISPDALNSSADIEAVAQEFEKVLDAILDRCPNTQCVHVFASVPVGMAFRLGACVSPTKHNRVQTYQFFRHATPKYARALVLQDLEVPVIVLDDIAKARVTETRRIWEEERQRLARFGATLQRHQAEAETWLPALFPGVNAQWSPSPRLAHLPPLWKVGFDKMRVGQASSALSEFRYDSNLREWQFGDTLLAGITRQVQADEDLRRAGRMFLLHEALHQATQGLTSATSARIGRFPKLLEEVDYIADVWAMLHDYALERDNSNAETDVHLHMLKCVDVALCSFWGFDDQGTELTNVQVRRLHRYLIWTWQRLRLEESGGEADVVNILFDRPMIELAGPSVVAHHERVLFDLDRRRVESPEIIVLDGNRVRRFGSAPGTPVANILEGFRRRDNTLIRDALQGVYDHVRKGTEC